MKKSQAILKKVISPEDIRQICFFCSKRIESKKTLEHIISDSLLGKLGIKEMTLTGYGQFQYSRIKVPAHSSCNNEFGSRYEEEVLNYFNDPKSLYAELLEEEVGTPLVYGPDYTKTALISTWLSKIYYGLFYNDFLKIKESEWKDICEDVIDSDNFRLIRRAYENNYGYYLPSSLYVFQSSSAAFDLRTIVQPQSILVKIEKLTFILCIGDGFLCKNYLHGDLLKEFRKQLSDEEADDNNFPSHLLALAEVVALRRCIPKTPSFVYSNDQIMNMSFSTGVQNPNEFYRIDENELQLVKREVLEGLGIEVR